MILGWIEFWDVGKLEDLIDKVGKVMDVCALKEGFLSMTIGPQSAMYTEIEGSTKNAGNG